MHAVMNMKFYNIIYIIAGFVVFNTVVLYLYQNNSAVGKLETYEGKPLGKVSSEDTPVWELYSNAVGGKMGISPNHVPVVIVDQHQEVIPYWYQAVEEGLMKGKTNTLVHIDAHSDMAPPEQFDGIWNFIHDNNPTRESFLPLMTANDAFIMSAVIKGLIRNIIWVRPSWSDNHEYNMKQNGYIGYTDMFGGDVNMTCECKENSKDPCMTFVRSDILENVESLEQFKMVDEEGAIKVARSKCRPVRRYTVMEVSEKRFIQSMTFKNLQNYFVDIDEDFFGVEGGVQAFINEGVKLETQQMLDEKLKELVCPQNIDQEADANTRVKQAFHESAHARVFKKKDEKEVKKSLRDEFIKLSQLYSCVSHKEVGFQVELRFLDNLIENTTASELEALSRIEYCLENSPSIDFGEPSFVVCHGNNFPGDTLNQIHVGNLEQVRERAENVVRILSRLHEFSQPRFYTIARSLRDGYTPRSQQSFIEKTLLQTIDNVLSKRGKKPHVVYHDELLFGKTGWV